MGKSSNNVNSPVFSRSIYPRNAKTRSGLMTNPKDNSNRRTNDTNLKFDKKRHLTLKPMSNNALTELEVMEEQATKKLLNKKENRFTLPASSPNNVNVIVSTIQRQRSNHNELMKTLSHKESSGDMEIL